MILLDTNVVSEGMKQAPNPAVIAWLNAQAWATMYLSAITVAELRVGIARLPAGKRRAMLHERLETEVLPRFDGRALPLDLPATQTYAEMMAKAERKGKMLPLPDAYIAAIALTHKFIVATRDTAPFIAAGLEVINPWEHEG